MIEAGGSALVLGGLGFIGTNLSLKLLQLGWTVTVVDPVSMSEPGITERVQELAGRVTVIPHGMQSHHLMLDVLDTSDVVFDVAGKTGHLASLEEPLEDINSNLTHHVEFLNAMRIHRPDIPVISTGTRQVLGNPEAGVLSDVSTPNPLDINGVSKLALESCLRVYGSTWGLQSVTLRLPNVYGPHMRVMDAASGVIGGWLGQSLRKGPLHVYDGGSPLRNVLHVDDATNAIIAGTKLAKPTSPALLVGGEEMSLRDIAYKIAQHTEALVEDAAMPRELQAIALGSAVIDDSPFRMATGWHPVIKFDQGIVECIRFYRERRHLYAS